MAIMNWNPKLSVGIDKIDQQHQKLIELINTLYDAMMVGKGKDKLDEILDELLNYTDYHFKTEEQLFEKYSYPDKIKHIKDHNDLRQKVMDFSNKLKSDKNTVITIEILNFLKEWINSHIINSDKKYTEFFSSRL